MKQYKKIIAAVAAAAILALPLSGCSFNDVMLYLYGGDSFTKEEGEDYQREALPQCMRCSKDTGSRRTLP